MKLILNKKNTILNQSGQSFIEFLLLFFILITMSFGILSGFNNKIGDQWKAIIQVLAKPNKTNSFNL